MLEQLDIISSELASIISFYYTFRVSNSSIHNHICKKCNIEQKAENFYKNPSNKKGRAYICKKCITIYL